MKKPPAPIHSLSLRCPACGEESPHRVLHVSAYRAAGYLAGIARCGQCRHSHPFEVRTPHNTVHVVVSDGARSRETRIEAPARRYSPGDILDVEGKRARVTRVEYPSEGPRPPALRAIPSTVWATIEGPARVKVSLSAGPKTIPLTTEVPREQVLRVGEILSVGGRPLRIYAIRVGLRTYDLEGYEAPAGKVVRVYARSARTPPPGRRD